MYISYEITKKICILFCLYSPQSRKQYIGMNANYFEESAVAGQMQKLNIYYQYNTKHDQITSIRSLRLSMAQECKEILYFMQWSGKYQQYDQVENREVELRVFLLDLIGGQEIQKELEDERSLYSMGISDVGSDGSIWSSCCWFYSHERNSVKLYRSGKAQKVCVASQQNPSCSQLHQFCIYSALKYNSNYITPSLRQIQKDRQQSHQNSNPDTIRGYKQV